MVSERTEEELELEEDCSEISSINVQSFVDEQEWRLYNKVVTLKSCVEKVGILFTRAGDFYAPCGINPGASCLPLYEQPNIARSCP